MYMYNYVYIYICIYAHVHVQQLDSLDYRRSHDKKDNSKTCDWIAAKLCRMVVFAEWWHNAQLTAIFHDSPGNLVPACPILDFISIKDAGGGDGESRSYKTCKAPVQLSPPTNQRPTFYRLDVLPATQPTVSEHWRDKVSHSTDLLTSDSPGLFQSCLWPLKTPSYLGEDCQVPRQPSDASTPCLLRSILMFGRSL